MPIYEYLCKVCDIQFQALIISKNDENEVRCSRCNGRNLKRLISRVAYHVSENDRLNAFHPQKKRSDKINSDF